MCPRRARLVTAASAASVVQPSSLSSFQSPSSHSRWSSIQRSSNPAASAWRTASRSSGQAVRWTQNAAPKRIAMRPYRRSVTAPMDPDLAVPPEARDAILAWYEATGRLLAFRSTADPYAVLVSELMAQQTQAARAAEAWTAWMARWPTVGLARRGAGGRRAPRVAGPRLQPPGAQPPSGRAGDRRAAWRCGADRPSRSSGRCPASVPTRHGRSPRSRSGCRSGRSTRTSGGSSGGSRAAVPRRSRARRCRRSRMPSCRSTGPDAWTHALMDLGARRVPARTAAVCRLPGDHLVPVRGRGAPCPVSRHRAGSPSRARVPLDEPLAPRPDPRSGEGR